MTERKNCDKDYPHVSHQWGIEFGDMGVAWYECDGRVELSVRAKAAPSPSAPGVYITGSRVPAIRIGSAGEGI